MSANTGNNSLSDSLLSVPEAAAVLTVDVQCAVAYQEMEDLEAEEPPSSNSLTAWAQGAYASVATQAAEVTIRLVDNAEMAALNRDYRGQHKTTNVLSFAFDADPLNIPELETRLLGDIVICHPLVVSEAHAQHKQLPHHYAHMVTHGILHLCGYDHQDDADARQMEALETRILGLSGIADPYR